MKTSEFHRKITKAFSNSELKTLCLCLDIDYEDLASRTRSGRVSELLLTLDRHERMGDLISYVIEVRPNTAWPSEDELNPLTLNGEPSWQTNLLSTNFIAVLIIFLAFVSILLVLRLLPVSVKGIVFLDKNENGMYEDIEPRIHSLNLIFKGADGVSHEVITSRNGEFNFKDVPLGHFVITIPNAREGNRNHTGNAERFVRNDMSIPLLPTFTSTPTPTDTATPSPTFTPTFTSTPTNTNTPTPTFTSTPMPTATPTNTAIPTPTFTSTPIPPPPCYRQASTDSGTIARLIHAEAEAVLTENMTIMGHIFAADAVIQDGASGQIWINPVSRYQDDLFPYLDFTALEHRDIQPAGIGIQGNLAYFTSSSRFCYNNEDGTSNCQETDPLSDHWTLERKGGCWVIINFSFNASHIPFPP